MIFGVLKNSTDFSISTERCSHFTMRNPKKSFSTVLFRLFRFSEKNTYCNPLATPPENVTALTSELQNFFIWLKACYVLSNVGGSEESQLWVVISGSEKNWLWCVATGMAGKQCHIKCSEWPPSISILFYTVSQKRHLTLAHSFTKCWPIFKILSLLDSVGNL